MAQKKALDCNKSKNKQGVSAMSTIVSRLDITQIFCDVDDLCSSWEQFRQSLCINIWIVARLLSLTIDPYMQPEPSLSHHSLTQTR